MSTTVVKGASTQASADPKAKSLVHPVSIADTPLAKGIAFGRLPVLLGLFAIRFDALVADPVNTLQTALPIVLAVQLAYAVVCLPVAGSQAAKAPKKLRPGEKRKTDVISPNAIAVSAHGQPYFELVY